MGLDRLVQLDTRPFVGRTGELFASSDEGEHWQALAERLPPVVCVKAAVVP